MASEGQTPAIPLSLECSDEFFQGFKRAQRKYAKGYFRNSTF